MLHLSPILPIRAKRHYVSFHSHVRVPNFALALVHEAWSEWCLGAFERSGINSLIYPIMSIDEEVQNKSFVHGQMVFSLYTYMMCLVCSFVILLFFHLLFV